MKRLFLHNIYRMIDNSIVFIANIDGGSCRRKYLDELEKGITYKRVRELRFINFCIRRIQKVDGKRVSLYFLNNEWKILSDEWYDKERLLQLVFS